MVYSSICFCHEVQLDFEAQLPEAEQSKFTQTDFPVEALRSKEQLHRMYLNLIEPHAKANGGIYHMYGCSTTSIFESEQVSSGGISSSALNISDVFSPYSTFARESTSILDKVLNTSDRHESYKCPGCKKTLKGELKNKPETWRKSCEHCNFKFKCAK